MEEEKHPDKMANEWNDIEPIYEERHFEIEIVDCIREDSNMQSDSDEVDQSDLVDIIDNDFEQQENKIEHQIIADEDSILEKFLTKRSPKKFNQPSPIDKGMSKIDQSYKDDSSQLLKSEYNVEYSVAANLSIEDNTER